MTADDAFEHEVAMRQFHTKNWLVERVVKLERQLDFLGDAIADVRSFGACCGHMMSVHTAHGCNGLTGSDDDWRSCRCTGWVPRQESP